jgi:hypothetical protein
MNTGTKLLTIEFFVCVFPLVAGLYCILPSDLFEFQWEVDNHQHYTWSSFASFISIHSLIKTLRKYLDITSILNLHVEKVVWRGPYLYEATVLEGIAICSVRCCYLSVRYENLYSSGIYAAFISVYRRFGTTHLSDLKASISDPWRWGR